MNSIEELDSLRGKRVLLRLDLNIPIKDGLILNDFRIKKILLTIKFLQNNKAKIIILSHIGRNKTDTLKPVFEYLKRYINIKFVDDILSEEADSVVNEMVNGDVVMMENLRKYDGEENNDENFSRKISRLGDIYVNEAFAVSHRKHSSIITLPKIIPSYSGILFKEEIDKLSKSFNPISPALFIIGGNKLNTKLPLIKKVLKNADHVFVGGALANNFFKEKGFNIGKSFVIEGIFGLNELIKNDKLVLPFDVVVQNNFDEIITKRPEDVLNEEKILDVGNETLSFLINLVKDSEFILMNGPLGNYEKGFGEPTEKLIKAISKSRVQTIIGGGDTTALINELGIENDFSFVSTGGGAMLDFLINGTLPGIQALN